MEHEQSLEVGHTIEMLGECGKISKAEKRVEFVLIPSLIDSNPAGFRLFSSLIGKILFLLIVAPLTPFRYSYFSTLGFLLMGFLGISKDLVRSLKCFLLGFVLKIITELNLF